MTADELYMARCIQLARCGEQGAAPNPMVGAVIVHQGRIVGEGYHIRCGQAHAEVNAFRSVKDESLLPQSTLYVSLEPCAHFGKTPPCARLVAEKGVRRVVVGCVDPFAKVQGRGIEMIRQAGIEVEVGVLEAECRELNRRFFTFHTKKRPYITLKWAQTADGVMGMADAAADVSRLMISSPVTMRRVHHLRATHSAILVGYRTALMDNPSLTVRQLDGTDPLRVVIDPKGQLPSSLRVFSDGGATLVFGYVENAGAACCPSVEYCPLQAGEPMLGQIMRELHRRNIQSVLVEGGRATLDAFLKENLWDEIHAERVSWEAMPMLSEGAAAVMAPQIDIAPTQCEKLGESIVYHYIKTV